MNNPNLKQVLKLQDTKNYILSKIEEAKVKQLKQKGRCKLIQSNSECLFIHGNYYNIIV